MLYSDRIGPPVAATSRGPCQLWDPRQTMRTRRGGRSRVFFLLGHRQAKRHARPKQKTSHCSERNCMYLFRGFDSFSVFFANVLVWAWPFSSWPSGILTVTVIGVHGVAG